MPKRGKEPRPSSRHSGGRFSPPPQPPRQPRNDYQIAGSSRSTCDSSSGRRSPHIKDNIKKSNGIVHPGNTPRILMRVVNSPIILTDDDDDDDNVYKNLDTSVNIFRENGNKLKPDTGEGASIVKHFVPSADRYHMSQSAPEKPVFRGPETDVLHDLGNDKLKIIRVQMIRADIQQNDSFRKAYVVEDSVAGNRSKDKNHQNFEERQVHFNQNNQQIHYDNDKNYGMAHPMSPSRLMSRDQSLSPRVNMVRPPSPPLPYSPERDHFNSDNNMLRRDRPKRSPERNVHDRPPRPEHFLEQHKMENFSSGPPPEPRSPEMQRFRPGDHNRHRVKDDPIHYDERPRHSGSPVYFENHYQFNRSMSPNNRPFSPNHEQQLPITPPSLRELSSPLRDRPPHPNERPRRRRTPPPRRDRSRERRRRISPRRRTPPPPVRSPIKRRENGKKRGPNKNQEARKREAKERKRRSQSKPKSAPQQEQQQQQNPFQQPQPQPMYPPPPPPGVVRMPPRPFPPGPMMIPLRPPPFPPPMGAWRPPRPMPAPPSGWPYPRTIHKNLAHFETLHASEFSHNIVKRGVNDSPHPLNKVKEVSFTTLGRDFRLILTPKKGLLHHQFEATSIDAEGNETPVAVDHDHFYDGRVFGEKSSHASVHLDKGVMTAIIDVPGETYHIEPSWRHMVDKDNKTMVTYKASDVRLSWEHSDLNQHKPCAYVKEDAEVETVDDDDDHLNSITRSKRDADSYDYMITPTRTRCPLLLVADYRFFREMGGGDTKTTINYLISLIDRVHKIYNDTLWLERQESDGFRGMGFVIKKITVHSDPTKVRSSEDHYNMVREKWDVRSLLEEFSKSKDVSKYCLAHLFTHQTFRSKRSSVLGLAYIASPRSYAIGGICSPGEYSCLSHILLMEKDTQTNLINL